MSSRNLFVCGASSDVGAALIERVADQYAKIFAHYRSSTDVIERLRQKFGDKIVPLQADLTDYGQTIRLAESLCERIDHFVHMPAVSAGINIKFNKTSWSALEDDMNISVRAAFLLCQAFLPQMVKNRYGKIVFMLTYQVSSNPVRKFSASYLTAKNGLLGLMRSLSSEYTDKGITVNGVSPSMIETKFQKDVPALVLEKNAAESPIGRNLTVDDVVPAFMFLLSSGADCITGQNITISAGN